jgi:hypothetical protein
MMSRGFAPLQHFLLVFDHDAGRLIDLQEFGTDGEAAVAAYSEREHEARERPRIEVVLIGSDSLDTVRLTHANYFDGSASISRYLDLARA